jgi:hypothetical protein
VWPWQRGGKVRHRGKWPAWGLRERNKRTRHGRATKLRSGRGGSSIKLVSLTTRGPENAAEWAVHDSQGQYLHIRKLQAEGFIPKTLTNSISRTLEESFAMGQARCNRYSGSMCRCVTQIRNKGSHSHDGSKSECCVMHADISSGCQHQTHTTITKSLLSVIAPITIIALEVHDSHCSPVTHCPIASYMHMPCGIRNFEPVHPWPWPQSVMIVA